MTRKVIVSYRVDLETKMNFTKLAGWMGDTSSSLVNKILKDFYETNKGELEKPPKERILKMSGWSKGFRDTMKEEFGGK